jgi:hypothetical protein
VPSVLIFNIPSRGATQEVSTLIAYQLGLLAFVELTLPGDTPPWSPLSFALFFSTTLTLLFSEGTVFSSHNKSA